MSVTVGGKLKVCVEPAVSEDYSAVLVGVDEMLVFPHVDTCVALLFVLEGGKVVGGHASRGAMNSKGAFTRAIRNVLTIAGRMGELADAKTLGIIAFGQFDTVALSAACWNWANAEIEIRDYAKDKSLVVHRVDTSNAPTGVDIFVDPGTRIIEVQHYKFDASRGALDPPKRTMPALIRNLDKLKGGALEPTKDDF